MGKEVHNSISDISSADILEPLFAAASCYATAIRSSQKTSEDMLGLAL